MSDAPQVAYSDAPIGNYSHRIQQSERKDHAYAHNGPAGNDALQKSDTILGLRRRNFWIWMIIAIIVVAAAVGGGVGGALAVKNSGSKSPSAAEATQNTSPASTRASTPSSSASASSPYVPLSAASVTEIDVSCPSSLKAFSDVYNYVYDCTEDTNIRGGDITGICAYSIQQCIDACSTMNLVQGAGTCKAVAIDRDALAAYRRTNGANCWLKNSSSPTAEWKRTTVAILKV